MPLIKCPECGKEISDKATSCPNCGNPFTRTSQNISPAYVQPPQYMTAAQPQKERKSEHKVLKDIITALCLFISPLAIVGIILMWAWKIPKSTFVRITATILFGGIFLFYMGGNSLSGTDIDTLTTQSSSTKNAVQSSVKEETTKNLTVGSSFSKNGLKITVNDADTNFTNYKDLYGLNTPKSGMKYLMVSFTFENTGSTDAYVSIYDFKCYADNTNCEQVFTLADNDFINTNLSSGRNVSFKTYYSIPENAQSIELEYETNIWTGKKVVITIQ